VRSFVPLGQYDGTVAARAVQAIKEAIATGRLQPGERLPSERKLAEAFGISRSSLRDALKMLSGMGAIQVRRRKGVFVANANDRVAASRRAVGMLLQRGALADLFEIREVLETQAAGWAAQRAGDAHIEKLMSVHRNLRRLDAAGLLTIDEASRGDSELHRLIAKGSGNAVLVRIMGSLRDLLKESRSRTTAAQDRMRKSLDEMGKVIDAIRLHDADEAKRAMLAHLKAGERASKSSDDPERA
jgi:GntR family transcriptional repressor for pyruvate dehydrogenase complex